MTLKKKITIAVGVFLAVLFVAGLSTLAATTYGTQSDPLVTLSYLNSTVKPSIETALDADIAAAEKNLEANLDASVAAFESDVSGMLASSSSSASASFTVVTLSSGQTLTCSVGTEIMLRVGSAASAGGSSPRLVDESSGSEISAAGTALTKNHMYMVTIQKNGVKATANGTKILIRGTYTIA